ncbi:MAG: hypothetical protein KatS3mg089_1024 [Patescibacteria group bacterium]|nr:MAG: hypothetical protein KatS3mg089_1024 [Patescibacteria group bacterium]
MSWLKHFLLQNRKVFLFFLFIIFTIFFAPNTAHAQQRTIQVYPFNGLEDGELEYGETGAFTYANIPLIDGNTQNLSLYLKISRTENLKQAFQTLSLTMDINNGYCIISDQSGHDSIFMTNDGKKPTCSIQTIDNKTGYIHVTAYINSSRINIDQLPQQFWVGVISTDGSKTYQPFSFNIINPRIQSSLVLPSEAPWLSEPTMTINGLPVGSYSINVKRKEIKKDDKSFSKKFKLVVNNNASCELKDRDDTVEKIFPSVNCTAVEGNYFNASLKIVLKPDAIRRPPLIARAGPQSAELYLDTYQFTVNSDNNAFEPLTKSMDVRGEGIILTVKPENGGDIFYEKNPIIVRVDGCPPETQNAKIIFYNENNELVTKDYQLRIIDITPGRDVTINPFDENDKNKKFILRAKCSPNEDVFSNPVTITVNQIGGNLEDIILLTNPIEVGKEWSIKLTHLNNADDICYYIVISDEERNGMFKGQEKINNERCLKNIDNLDKNAQYIITSFVPESAEKVISSPPLPKLMDGIYTVTLMRAQEELSWTEKHGSLLLESAFGAGGALLGMGTGPFSLGATVIGGAVGGVLVGKQIATWIIGDTIDQPLRILVICVGSACGYISGDAPPCLYGYYAEDLDANGNPIREPRNLADPKSPDFTSDLNARKENQKKIVKCAGVITPFGAFSSEPGKFIKDLLRVLLSISGGIVLLLIIRSGYQLMTSQGNPEKITEAKDRITSAIIGLLFLIFSLVILEVIGVDILNIPGFSG